MEASLPEDHYLDRCDLSSNNLYHSHHAPLLLSVSFSQRSIIFPSLNFFLLFILLIRSPFLNLDTFILFFGG